MPENLIDLDDIRNKPLDSIMEDLEYEFRSGRIGITRNGEAMRLQDIYHDLKRANPKTDYHIASPRGIDREYQRQHNPCTTAYRTTEQKETETDLCPFCHKPLREKM